MKFKNYQFLQDQEGLRLTAYQDSGGIWTIGYGHTGPEVKRGLTITQEKATVYLINDVAWAEKAVNDFVKANLTQNQFDSLVSLTYNIGVGDADGYPPGLRTSTVVKRINIGDYSGAAEALTWWNKVNGAVSRGLVARRSREKALFLKQDDALPFPSLDEQKIRDEQIKALTDKFVKDLLEIIK